MRTSASCESRQPFGSAVVPDVYIISATLRSDVAAVQFEHGGVVARVGGAETLGAEHARAGARHRVLTTLRSRGAAGERERRRGRSRGAQAPAALRRAARAWSACSTAESLVMTTSRSPFLDSRGCSSRGANRELIGTITAP